MKKSKNKTHQVKKSQSSNPTEAKEADIDSKTTTEALLDDDEQGFGGWLKSADGLDTMKLFVIANSIVFVTTLAYPHIQAALQILAETLYGPDSYY